MVKLNMKVIRYIYAYVLKSKHTIKIHDDKLVITDIFNFEWEYNGRENFPFFKKHMRK